jgi:hypothetical protein
MAINRRKFRFAKFGRKCTQAATSSGVDAPASGGTVIENIGTNDLRNSGPRWTDGRPSEAGRVDDKHLLPTER